MLDASIDLAPDAVPVLVLQLFGGLRRSEAEELTWEDIREDYIEVKGHIAKTRRRRLNKVTRQLHAWLKTAQDVGGKLPAVNYADKLKTIIKKAKLKDEYAQNALRHSFASYHYALNRNENETAAMMGNSPQMVFQHYRELVRPEDAEKFFAIMPPRNAVKRAEAARKRQVRVMPQRESKITASVLSAVFQNGGISLTRKEAVAAVVAAAKVSVAAAYNALALDGRFKKNLAEADGKLSWRESALTHASGEPTPA